MDILTETTLHPLPDGELTLLGAARAVTPAFTRVDTGGSALLIDCGVPQGAEARGWRFPDPARGVKAVVLTHGHNDHVGSLPLLLEGGFAGPIFGTRATLDIADLVIADGLKLQGAGEDEIARQRARLRALMKPVHYDEPFTVPDLDGTVMLHEAGHILGSSSVEVETRAVRLICSGDLGRPESPLLRDYHTGWSQHRPIDLVVMESTYGDREHRMDHAAVERALEAILHRAVTDGGHILVPAFAIGRTQTLLYHLNSLVEAGRAPNIPVAVDTPLGLRVTELYARARHLFDRASLARLAEGDDPLVFEDLFSVNRHRDSVRLRDVKDPMLIIAGNGMCTGGRIVGHLQELLPRPETTVVFVGYQAPGTPGRAIQEAAELGGFVRLGEAQVAVRARIETLGGLSAHADRVELARWLSHMPEVGRLALHHGDPGAQAGFAAWWRDGAAKTG
jgi:metallo-beta-lactamase family protein